MYLAFDVGTTSVKTALFDGQGRLLGKTIRSCALDTPRVDWYEVDPSVYWKAVTEGFAEILRTSGVDPKSVRAISGCSQGETIVLLDPHGPARAARHRVAGQQVPAGGGGPQGRRRHRGVLPHHRVR